MNLNNVVAVRNIKTVYRDGDKAIKVFNEDYSKADVLNEALNQARVEETDLDIPGSWKSQSWTASGRSCRISLRERP